MNIFIPVLMSAFDIWKDNARQKQKKKKDHDFYNHNRDASSQVRLSSNSWKPYSKSLRAIYIR